jgi:hypothetical protein
MGILISTVIIKPSLSWALKASSIREIISCGVCARAAADTKSRDRKTTILFISD